MIPSGYVSYMSLTMYTLTSFLSMDSMGIENRLGNILLALNHFGQTGFMGRMTKPFCEETSRMPESSRLDMMLAGKTLLRHRMSWILLSLQMACFHPSCFL